MTVTFRLMSADDVPAVAWLDAMSNALPWSQKVYQREARQENGRAWVAEVEAPQPLHYGGVPVLPWEELTCPAGSRAVAGFLCIWYVLDEAHIANIAIHPDLRGQGLGRGLLVHGLKQAATDGMTMAQLEVRVSNVPAIQLYRSLGFVQVGRRERYYQDNHEDALLMDLKSLSAFMEA